MYIYVVYIQFLFIILNLHMSKKSSNFAGAKLKTNTEDVSTTGN